MKLAIRAVCLACGEKHAVIGVHCAGALKEFLDEQRVSEQSVSIDFANGKDQTVYWIYDSRHTIND